MTFKKILKNNFRYPLMDIIKFVCRSLMRGEIHLFRHRFSVHMQLIHGHPLEAAAGTSEPAYAQSVVTRCPPTPFLIVFIVIQIFV